MSRGLGFDPLGFDSVGQAEVRRTQTDGMARALDAYRVNLVVRGVTVADRTNQTPVGPPIGDDGRPLTLEDRVRIAAGRRPYGSPDADYRKDLEDREVEPLGESAQKKIMEQPEFRVVKPRELLLPGESPAENP